MRRGECNVPRKLSSIIGSIFDLLSVSKAALTSWKSAQRNKPFLHIQSLHAVALTILLRRVGYIPRIKKLACQRPCLMNSIFSGGYLLLEWIHKPHWMIVVLIFQVDFGWGAWKNFATWTRYARALRLLPFCTQSDEHWMLISCSTSWCLDNCRMDREVIMLVSFSTGGGVNTQAPKTRRCHNFPRLYCILKFIAYSRAHWYSYVRSALNMYICIPKRN